MRPSVAAAAKRLDQAQAVAFVLLLARLGRGRRRRPPLSTDATFEGTISVVVPARHEAARIGPCLDGLRSDADLLEIIVVDDGSTDDTAERARRSGARVVPAGPPPRGWVGKPWALQRGLESARGDVVVSLDADTRPAPGLARALAARLAEADLVSAGARIQRVQAAHADSECRSRPRRRTSPPGPMAS